MADLVVVRLCCVVSLGLLAVALSQMRLKLTFSRADTAVVLVMDNLVILVHLCLRYYEPRLTSVQSVPNISMDIEVRVIDRM